MIFTPDMTPGSTYPGETMSDGRAVMDVSVEDRQRYLDAQDGTWTLVTDTKTGTSWEVRRADCGAGCRCAAEARTPALVDA